MPQHPPAHGPLPFELPADPVAFQRAVRPFLIRVNRTFGPQARATSALQDVLLRALNRGPGAAPGRRGLWCALVNRVRDQFRRARSAQRHEMCADATARRTESATAGDQEIDDTVLAALARVVDALSPADRDLWHRFAQGASYAAIAGATGRSLAAVKQAAFRIRKRVAAALPPEFHPHPRTDLTTGCT